MRMFYHNSRQETGVPSICEALGSTPVPPFPLVTIKLVFVKHTWHSVGTQWYRGCLKLAVFMMQRRRVLVVMTHLHSTGHRVGQICIRMLTSSCTFGLNHRGLTNLLEFSFVTHGKENVNHSPVEGSEGESTHLPRAALDRK